ncbi:regulator of G-protein signaling 4 [Clarias gariepinus]|uniref:regulator of G-protein signaling 4 n=1 Tax=Clarias gariepinus TaxID=13013 RepID=UPI00234D2A87|nr:regulator of G-protein signaling 4 [Clarias gariepinus]
MCKGLAALPATCLKSAKDIKHKIGFLLQKVEPGQEQKAVKEKEKPTQEKSFSPVDTENWKTSFNNLINNDVGRAAFTAFLKSEFSQENIQFWVACEDFKRTPEPEMQAKAKQIFKQYIDVDSLNEVNLDSATREETRRNLERCDVTCFEEAQSKIFTLMEKDSYRRFLKSKLFLDLSQPCRDEKHCRPERKGTFAEFNQCLLSHCA